MQPDTLSMLVVALARALSLLKGTFATPGAESRNC
jgi:hypothetical protein